MGLFLQQPAAARGQQRGKGGLEVGATEKIFTTPDDPRTEQYVTGKFG